MKKPTDEYKKYCEKYELSLVNFKTVKTSLKSIVKKENVISKIRETVLMVNQIVFHTYNFSKLYCIRNFEKRKKLPEINTSLINCIMKTLCRREGRGKTPEETKQKLMNILSNFYDKHYVHLMGKIEKFSYTNLNTVLDYEAISIKTCFNNHIRNHFYDFLARYINVFVGKEKTEADIESAELPKTVKENLLRKFRNKIKKVKKDVINNENNCSSDYNYIKNRLRDEILPKLKKIHPC